MPPYLRINWYPPPCIATFHQHTITVTSLNHTFPPLFSLGFGAFVYILGFILLAASAIYTSPLICGTSDETKIIKSPHEINGGGKNIFVNSCLTWTSQSLSQIFFCEMNFQKWKRKFISFSAIFICFRLINSSLYCILLIVRRSWICSWAIQ